VGVGPCAGWKGVAVGLAFGFGVANVNGRAEAAGEFPQAVRASRMNRLKVSDARWLDGFIGLGLEELKESEASRSRCKIGLFSGCFAKILPSFMGSTTEMGKR